MSPISDASRAAARLMHIARAATPGPWLPMAGGIVAPHSDSGHPDARNVAAYGGGLVAESMSHADAVLGALMDPLVAQGIGELLLAIDARDLDEPDQVQAMAARLATRIDAAYAQSVLREVESRNAARVTPAEVPF